MAALGMSTHQLLLLTHLRVPGSHLPNLGSAGVGASGTLLFPSNRICVSGILRRDEFDVAVPTSVLELPNRQVPPCNSESEASLGGSGIPL